MIASALILTLCAPQFGGGEIQALRLPTGLPTHFEVVVDRADQALTLRLERTSVRSENFRLHEVGADGLMVEIEAPPVRTYRGSVLGLTGSDVAGSLGAEGLSLIVLEPDGSSWFVEPLSEGAGGHEMHRVFSQEGSIFDVFRCGTDSLPVPPTQSTNRGPDAGGSGSCLAEAEIAFDADFEYFQNSGSSSANVIANIDAVLIAVNAIYARDVGIAHVNVGVTVRTAEPDPYQSADANQLLNEFVSEWNGNMGNVQRDMAHLITGKSLLGSIIGLAYVGVVCNPTFGYGLSQFTYNFSTLVGLLGHELGHNWNAPHCLDPGCFIMCGSCHQFGPVTAGVVRGFRDSIGCLGTAAGNPSPVAPNAVEDVATTDVAARIDVLANDFDGNCETVGITAFDLTTSRGGTVSLSAATGPGGRDELLYTPPVTGGPGGADVFNYTVGDGSGLQDSTTVTVTDSVPDLVAHWKLDDTLALIAVDSSGGNHHGTYIGAPAVGQSSAAASLGSAVDFDGVNDHVQIIDGPGLTTLTSDLTIAAWINPDSLTGNRRIFGNPASWSFGFSGGLLTFSIIGVRDYVLNLGVPLGSWSHVAAVYDRNLDVTFYVDGVRMGTVVGVASASTPLLFWHIGSLDGIGELFNGRIDDVRLLDAAMTDNDVLCLYRSATNPLFTGTPATISLAAGGIQALGLCAGPQHAGKLYFVVGSTSGTAPGIPFGGLTIPLNPDPYLLYTINNPAGPPLVNASAILGSDGKAQASFVLGAGTDPALVGLSIHHACGVIDPARLSLDAISNPAQVFLLP